MQDSSFSGQDALYFADKLFTLIWGSLKCHEGVDKRKGHGSAFAELDLGN
jgi:hypothetical protein